MAEDNVYDNGMYVIEPGQNITIIKQDYGNIPSKHQGYEVANIGRAEVHVAFKHGSKVSWHGTACDGTIQPGQKMAFPAGRRLYLFSALVVTNTSTMRAIISAYFLNQQGPYNYDLEYSNTFSDSVCKAVNQIVLITKKKALPIEQGVSMLLETFWPLNNKCIWLQIYEIIYNIIDNEMICDTVKNSNIPDLFYFRDRFEGFLESLEEGDQLQIAFQYMGFAEDLDKYEDMFVYKSSTPKYLDLNFALLPLYSQVIFMKLSFYAIGILKAHEYGLQENQVENLKEKSTLALFREEGAVNYINNLCTTFDEHIYATADPKSLYNAVSGVRSYIAVCGLQYIPIWEGIIENATHEPYNDVIVYSPLFGKQTVKLVEEAVRLNLRQPITPKMMPNGLRNTVRHLFVYLHKVPNREDEIHGIEVCFLNADTYFMGNYPCYKDLIDFYDCKLLKLSVAGIFEVNYMRFHFSDDRVVEFGHIPDNANTHDFELEGHHIASIFVSSDFYDSGKAFDNVVVAYRLTTDESHLNQNL